ncbi:MAG: diacylglycerol kinase family protein [bacterium]
MKIEVIVNASSGTGENGALEARLNELFARDGLRSHVALAQSGHEIVELAQRAARGDADIIVAGGGDGTINSVTSQLLTTKKTLGVLPLGTLNHFAKDLHIPLELEAAVETIIKGHVANVDLGEVNGHIFVNNSSLGLYPSIVREREKQQRLGWGKWPAYVWAGVAVLRRYPFLDIRLDVDGKALSSRTPFVFIGNNEYEMESLNVGGRACLDAGELSLYVTNRTDRLGLVRLALRALFGGLRQEKDFLAMCTKEIWIETKHKRVRVALDGEVRVMEPPLHYRVLPGKLRVLAPANKSSC